MGNTKRNLIVSFYLLAVLGLGLSSLFIGRRVADRQREIAPQEAEAGGLDCVQCCWQEWGPYKECPPGEEECMREGCKRCGLRKRSECNGNPDIWADDCQSPRCEEKPTPTPTPTPTEGITPTPTPPPSPLVCLDLTSDQDVTSLEEGDVIKLTCAGESGVNHVEFRVQIDGGSWQNLGTASPPESSIDYTISQTGDYRIECRVCSSADDSVCAQWGMAE